MVANLCKSASTRRFIGVAVLLSLAACATQRDIQPTLRPLDAAPFGLAPAQPLSTDQIGEIGQTRLPFWWAAYGDAQLSALMDQALAQSPSIQIVQSRLRRAQAQVSAREGQDKPQLQATAEVDRQRFSGNGLYPPPIAGSIRTSGTAQFEGSWELDLFGKQRAELAAAIGQSRAAQADAQAAQVLLSSQVARAYVQLARLLAQRDVAQRSLAQRDETLQLIRQRVGAGLDTTVELRQGESALPDSRQQIEALNEQIGLTRHALAALTGQAPQALDALAPSLQGFKPLPAPDTIPMDLLARRADITAARWRVEAAGHQVDAARALFYPNIDIRGYLGYNAIGLDRLLRASSTQWGLLPAVHLPLFDGDRRRAGLKNQVAEQDGAIAGYNQSVIDAVHEVADQLGSAQSIDRQRQEQQSAQAGAEAAYSLALQRYRAGLGTYLTVLTAETAVLNQRRQELDLQARALDVQVALVRALGGSLQGAPQAVAAAQPATATPRR